MAPAGLDSRLSAKVYPRAYGGTRFSPSFSIPVPGLSPRVRGNHESESESPSSSGSIPARTGEPVLLQHEVDALEVYPRAYGGTAQHLSSAYLDARSIPARTGEPASPTAKSAMCKVYPRAYGGTRWRWMAEPELAGSIPARTGEPSTGLSDRL